MYVDTMLNCELVHGARSGRFDGEIRDGFERNKQIIKSPWKDCENQRYVRKVQNHSHLS